MHPCFALAVPWLALGVASGPSVEFQGSGASSGAPVAARGTEDPDLAELEHALEEAGAAWAAKESALARERIGAAVELALELLGERTDEAAARMLERLGTFAGKADERRAARAAFERLVEVRTKTLPEEHDDLLSALTDLTNAKFRLGDYAGARELEERLLVVRERTLPEDHPNLQVARHNLASTRYQLGDLAGARELQERVLEIYERTLPADHPSIQRSRQQLGRTIEGLGDFEGARALYEQVLEVRERTLPAEDLAIQDTRLKLASVIGKLGDLKSALALERLVFEARALTLPDDHPELLLARFSLATTLANLEEFREARKHFERLVEVWSQKFPADHPDLQLARQYLGSVLRELGDHAGARETQESVIQALARSLPADHERLVDAQESLASALFELGDLAGARSLYERVLEVRTRKLRADHPDVQQAQANLAAALKGLGDVAAARALEERVLEVRARTLPDDHDDLQDARQNLSTTLQSLREGAEARALRERVLEIRSRSLTDDHPALQSARSNLAASLYALGELAEARALQEKVLAIRLQTLPEDHRDVQVARHNLAATLDSLGESAAARPLQERALQVFARILPEDHQELLMVRAALATSLARMELEAGGGSARGAELLVENCVAITASARRLVLASAPREAEERCAAHAIRLGQAISLALRSGAPEGSIDLEAACFALSETTRAAGLAAATWMRRADGAPEHAKLRAELREASEELARLAQKGTTSEEFRLALRRREDAERALLRSARESSGDAALAIEPGEATLAARLSAGTAVVAFRRYERWSFEGSAGLNQVTMPSLCAFVVRPVAPGAASADALELVDLGPLAPVEEAVRAWRAAIGTEAGERGLGVSSLPDVGDVERDRGAALRALLLDPLLGALEGAERLVLLPDDVLHLVAFDALPLRDDAGLVGDRWRIETRASVAELLAPRRAREGEPVLVALGGASFDDEPLAVGVEEPAGPEAEPAEGGRRIEFLRGGAWEHGFGPLANTGLEARAIADLLAEVRGEQAHALVLERRHASRGALVELAPRARWMHVATHGWFASDAVRSWSDGDGRDPGMEGSELRLSAAERIRGMSPMLLCGLALAGANRPMDEVGRAPGLVTAEELSTLDLGVCELAVLSACDTNVGERRAGQGVASLQKALHMAGARSVLTSLWKVPDEATRVLMTDFYRRIWSEKASKAEALWEAKRRLREMRDAAGRPLYTTRDWAAWVLSGEPE